MKFKLFIISFIISVFSFVFSSLLSIYILRNLVRHNYILFCLISFFIISILSIIIYFVFSRQVNNKIELDENNNLNNNSDNDFDIFEEYKSLSNINTLSEISGVMIGIFKVYSNRVLISRNLMQFLGYNFEVNDFGFADISVNQFDVIKTNLLKNALPNAPDIYYFNSKDDSKWLNIFIKNESNCEYGVVIDITSHIIKEYNNDSNIVDALTGIYTREAFTKKVKDVLSTFESDTGCLFTIEFDYLQNINDNYGLKIGDEYVKKACKFLLNSSENTVIGKKSSSEFLIYIHGFSTKSKIKRIIENWVSEINVLKFTAPDDKIYKIKFTAGYCYYPDDADNIEKMLGYSSYALYEAKKLYKGTVHAFSMKMYNEDYFVEKKIEAFNNLIYENQVTYKYQPIVSLKNGSIFGYEALMRPINPIFKSPKEVISIAKSENNLYMLEKMTVANCLEILYHHKEFFKEKKFFYNTMASQTLNDEDILKFKNMFEDIGHLLVCEVILDDDTDDVMFMKKCSILKDKGDKVAIDCFGTERCNNEEFFKIRPNYVKIDRSLITDISIKKDKQSLVARYVKMSKKYSSTIIAVGVETRDELRTLVKLGVDFAQGYYFSLPKARFIEEINHDIVEEIIKLNSQ